MSKALEEYVKFNVLGIEEDLVTQEDKDLIYKLNQRKHILERYMPRFNNELDSLYFTLETYSKEKQCDIFNGLKLRQGEKARLTFMNDQNMPVEITGAQLKHNKVLLNCVFCKTRKTFGMWLDTFLNDYYVEEITKVKPDGFVNSYLISVEDSLEKTKKELEELYNKYNKIYKDKQSELQDKYNSEVSQYTKIEKEAKSNRYQMSSEEALETARKYKGVERTKDYWNTKITSEEKETLLKWIAENIYSIRVYGLLGGQSGNILANNYVVAGTFKYREPKYNDEGKVTSQDSIVAHISFKTIEDAPMEILKKVISTKNRNENVFYKNRLNDKNLALFLLSEYVDKGFKAGIRNLYKQIVLD